MTPELTQYETMKKLAWESEQRVVWEYYNGKSWEALAGRPTTPPSFTGSGFVSVHRPRRPRQDRQVHRGAYWVRARLEMGGYVKFPRVRRILSNVVEAYHHQTINDEVLGNGDGTPLQQYKLLHGPVLSGEVLEVRERETPREADLADLGPNPVRKAEPDNADSNEVWVRWRQVDSFFESTPTSRHYTLDYLTGMVAFGDGRRGMAPPTGRNGVVMRTYKIGGGASGNVNAGTITSMVRALSYIDTVTNPLPATGGSDRESVEDAKRRAPYTIKSRDRAVTAEDFEMLALRASTSLARAKCVPDRSNRGQITLVLIPKAETRADDLTRRLLPSHEIMRYIKRYLDERRLVGTIVNVIKPRYKDLSIKVTLLRRTVGTSDRLRREIELKVRRFLHPLLGGKDGKGWEFGRPVLKSDLVHHIEEIPGVDGVDGDRHARRAQGRHRRARPHRRRRAALPHQRHHRGESPRRHPLMATELINRKVVRVPEVNGLGIAKARIILEDAGLKKVAVLYREGYEEHDTVVDQRPARGQMVYETTEVVLWIARRGYLQYLPALYRRSDAVGHNVVRDLCFLYEHMFGHDRASRSRRTPATTTRRRPRPTSCRGWRRGWPSPSTSTGPTSASARSCAGPSTCTGSAGPSAPWRCSSSCSPATSRRSTRTSGPSRASASRPRPGSASTR
jgi:hypothetical protein